MKILYATDANTPAAGSGGGASSPPEVDKPAEQGAATAPPADAKKEEVPFDEQAIAEVAKQHPETKSAESSPATGQEAAASGEVGKSNKTDDKEGQKKEGDKLPVGDKPAKGEFDDLPFHKHERFVQLIDERKTLKEVVEKAKPQLERLDALDSFCNTNGITPEQFKNGVEILALLNTNPQEAAKRLQPTLEALGKYEGTMLPKELQDAVDSGALPLEYAQRIVRSEQQKNFVQQRSQQTVQQQREQMLTGALTSWEAMVRKADPNYEKKSALVNSYFVNLTANQPWQTPQQIVALAQQAYDEVNKVIVGFVPKPPPTRQLQSEGRPSAQRQEPKKWDEVEDYLVDKFSGAQRK